MRQQPHRRKAPADRRLSRRGKYKLAAEQAVTDLLRALRRAWNPEGLKGRARQAYLDHLQVLCLALYSSVVYGYDHPIVGELQLLQTAVGLDEGDIWRALGNWFGDAWTEEEIAHFFRRPAAD